MVAIDLSGQWLNLASKQIFDQLRVFRLEDDFNYFLDWSRAVHVYAKFYWVFLSCKDDTCQHVVICNLNESLGHVVTKGVSHQTKEVLDCALKHDFDSFFIFL